MNGKCRKIHKKRILSRIVAEAYYTYQGVSQRSIKLQRDTPFLWGNQSVVKSFSGLRFVVCSCPGVRSRYWFRLSSFRLRACMSFSADL